MKIDAQEILQAVKSVMPACPVKSALDIVTKLHIEKKGGTLRISSTDLENTFSYSFSLEGVDKEEDFSVCVDPKLLLSSIEDANSVIDFIINRKKKIIEIGYNDFLFEIGFQDGEDFPKSVDVPPNARKFQVKLDAFLALIESSLPFVSSDFLKPQFCGINLEATHQNFLQAVATDGFSLAITEKIPIEQSSHDSYSFILDAQASKKIKSLKWFHSAVEIVLCENKIGILGGNFSFFCRIIDAKFPDYRTILAKGVISSLSVNRKEILTKLRKITPFSSTINHLATFSINLQTSKIYIVSKSDDVYSNRNSVGSTEVSINAVDGGEFPEEIGFNAKYFLRCLTFFEEENISMCFSSASNSSFIWFRGEENEKCAILQPILLNA